ncbi:hypothetical protein PUN28_001908 [Cardiocondyla obscurior]|uniref:Uncharacterized protein n=1 Tax=Cardiocondyla obscurior TaxID=286306 RepID=A0AAW2GRY2_9HYME
MRTMRVEEARCKEEYNVHLYYYLRIDINR